MLDKDKLGYVLGVLLFVALVEAIFSIALVFNSGLQWQIPVFSFFASLVALTLYFAGMNKLPKRRVRKEDADT